jgi:flagellar biosynthetic protein FliQ
MDEVQMAVDLGRASLMVAVKLTFPALAVGLVVGLLISVFQAATQIQEQTLAFIPKMFVVVVVLFATMPWMLTLLVETTQDLMEMMLEWVRATPRVGP